MTKSRDLADNSQNTKPKVVINKGDLIVGTQQNSADRLGVGSNGYTLVADSSTSTGLAYSPTFFAGKNKLINADFRFNQRNFTSTTSNGSFFADRWQNTLYVGTGTFTTPTIAYGSFANQTSNKVLRITSSSATNDFGLQQKIEDVSTFAGQTITVSCWIRSSGTTFNVDLVEAFQYFGVGGSAGVYSYADLTGKTFGSSWTRLSFQIAIPSVAGKTIGTSDYLQIRIDPATTLPSGEWIEITHIQAEAGSVATQFQTATGTIQGELAACQRYYWRLNAASNYSMFGSGHAIAGNQCHFYFQNPVPMRVTATSYDQSSLTSNAYAGASAFPLTSGNLSLNSDSNTAISILATGTIASATFTTGNIIRCLANNTTSAYIGFSAEL